MSAKPTIAYLLLPLALGLIVPTARAEAPSDFLARFDQVARAADAGFRGFSAQRGERFFKSRHGADWSCASCHSDNPVAPGRHAVTGKAIGPLAPAANAERFSSARQVEKWFKRNCNDVLERACTAQEKGDVLAYLLTLRK